MTIINNLKDLAEKKNNLSIHFMGAENSIELRFIQGRDIMLSAVCVLVDGQQAGYLYVGSYTLDFLLKALENPKYWTRCGMAVMPPDYEFYKMNKEPLSYE